MERLNPLDDYLFIRAFGEKGDETQLLEFLNAILERTGRDRLVSVEIREDKTLTAEYIGDKSSILDVRARTDTGDYVNIEVQLKDLHNMPKRSLFYWGKQYVKNMEAGDEYSELSNVIAINIVNFDCNPLEDYHTSYHLREDRNTGYILTDAIEIHFINMARFRRLKIRDIKNNILERWLTYLDETTPLEIIEEVINMDATIQKTHERYTFLSEDKETRHLYEMRQQGRRDWNTVIAEREKADRRTEEANRRTEEANRRTPEANRRTEEAERRIAELEASLLAAQNRKQ
jgi:predicted transposase/invertase (TIGR01784 family)